jgi:hypothetical protein
MLSGSTTRSRLVPQASAKRISKIGVAVAADFFLIHVGSRKSLASVKVSGMRAYT